MKRELGWMLCGTMLINLLSGCGGGSDAAGGESATSGTEGAIKIGYFGPLTGGTAQAGQAALNGVQIAVNELNESGGILGRQVEIVSYDDKSSPEEAVKAATKLVQVNKVNAIFGSLHSANVQAAGPVIEESQTLCVAGGTSPTWLEQGYTYLFRSISNSTVSAKQLARYANDQGYHKIALFTSNDEYGTSGADGFKSACADYNIEFVANETMTNGDRDFTGQFAKITAAVPDAVFIWCLGDDLGAVTKQMRQSGFSGPILGSESYTLPEILQNAGDAANGVCFAAQYLVYENPEDAEDQNMKTFLEAYLEEFGAAPASDNAFRAYDGVKMIAEAMETSGVDHGAELREAYNNIDGYVGLAGTFSYKGKNGEGIDSMRIFEIKDGKYIEAE
ncbi:ABC transporter substrate-binding protein [Butyricicoccus sp. Marseille-Q5471]|uniref:ABC transporter substrate-binding protein n=1 Tax=Butyricicoccus sp. Marseille-Q5471 TaxID=3039493 RepID=UPI0024BC6247|nr:ABC transporter substrate-binding protein [Butyricicoccus sp. Marseille-Q5471]